MCPSPPLHLLPQRSDQKHQRLLGSTSTQEGVVSQGAATKLREVTEVLDPPPGPSPSPIRREHVACYPGCQAFSGTPPRSWECRLASLICTALAMVELNRQATSDEKAKIGEGAVGILAWHWGACCSCWESAEIVPPRQVREIREIRGSEIRGQIRGVRHAALTRPH